FVERISKQLLASGFAVGEFGEAEEDRKPSKTHLSGAELVEGHTGTGHVQGVPVNRRSGRPPIGWRRLTPQFGRIGQHLSEKPGGSCRDLGGQVLYPRGDFDLSRLDTQHPGRCWNLSSGLRVRM